MSHSISLSCLAQEDNYRHVMRTFLDHARNRKRALDNQQKDAARAVGQAWNCLDNAGGGGGGGGGGRREEEDEEKAAGDGENIFAVLFEFVNKFDREVKSTQKN